MKQKLAIGADHAGYHYKEQLAGILRQAGLEVEDYGTYSDDSVVQQIAALIS